MHNFSIKSISKTWRFNNRNARYKQIAAKKAKPCPQPSENQSLDMFPQTQKGIFAAPERVDPGSRKTLYFRLFQPLVMFFSTSKLQSRRVHFCPNHLISLE